MNQPQTRKTTARLKMLHAIDQIALSSRTPSEVAIATLPYLRSLISYQRASLVLFNFDAGHATVLAVDSDSQTELRVGHHMPLTDFQGITSIQTGQLFIIQDITKSTTMSVSDKKLLAENIQAYMMVPLIAQGELLGSLNFGVTEPNSLALADAEGLREVADQVAVALSQALALEADQRRLLESEAIITISQALNETLDLQEVFQLIAESAWQIIPPAERTVIHLLDEQEQILRPITVTRGGEIAHGGLMMRPGEGIAGHVVAEGKLINVTDTHIDARFLASSRARHRSLMVAPIKGREGIIGTITVQSVAAHAFATNDERLLLILGSQAALAIKNARLFAAEQQARFVAETLRAANVALTKTLDLDSVLTTLLEYIYRLVPYDSANVMLCQGTDQLVLSALRGYENWVDDVAAMQEMTFAVVHPTIQPIFTTRHTMLIADTANHPDWDSSVGATHVRSWLGVPLLAAGEVIGLYSLDKAEANFFTSEHQELAEAFAGQAALAVYNALLYKAERQQFRRLQQSQMQLVQAEKMGALGRLVASIAHEINNPIQAMQGCLTLTTEELEEANPDPETIDLYLGIVKSELTRVATIVSNMRDFYRPAAAVMDLTDLQEVLESVLKLTGKQLQRSNIEVVRKWGEDLPLIEANSSHLRQVFLNLVLNAIDAMPHGGHLQVEMALLTQLIYEQKRDSAVRIRVRDSGVGMSEETASRLFEPFFTTKDQGSGLGLSISYGIIEAHHGEITVASRVGAGTTFTILLPIKQSEGQ